jgi:DNA polymerase-3 subunit beta
MFYEIVRKLAEGAQVVLEASGDRAVLAIRAGRSRFTLQTLPESDFPDLAAGEMTHSFKLAAADLKRLIDKTQFAISTEETRYYLNGIEDSEAEITVELSQGKIRFTIGDTVLTSKLIDGTFPDYARVIPVANDKELTVDKKEFEQAVDRVSTVSSERGRAVKLSLSNGKLMLSVTNPDSGSATEEIEVEYGAEPLDIGFNSRYLLDIAAQLEGEAAVLKLADPGSPTLIQDRDTKGALYVLMPMRV